VKYIGAGLTVLFKLKVVVVSILSGFMGFGGLTEFTSGPAREGALMGLLFVVWVGHFHRSM
jgi:uncharacterized membrane protein YtjA (UPF0391 family)